MNVELPRKRILGYADEISVAPGDRIEFKLSCESITSYQADIVRLRSADLHPAGRGWIEQPVSSDVTGEYPAREQLIDAGSYGRVESDKLAALTSFTFQLWVWPTTPGAGAQVLMGCWSSVDSRGVALTLNEHGAVALRLGGATFEEISLDQVLPARQWALVGGSFDAETGLVSVWHHVYPPYVASAQALEVSRQTEINPDPSGLVFMLAASNGAGPDGSWCSSEHFNGKLENPSVYDRAFTPLQAARAQAGQRVDEHCVAAWDFSVGIETDSFTDISGHGLQGKFVNLPARAMTGQSWDGEIQDWKQAPSQYGAVHFHDDDIYDCRWATDFHYDVPTDLSSGIYAARCSRDDDHEYVPFVVRPELGAGAGRALVLLPTASYMAYANEFCGSTGGGHIQVTMNHATALSAQDLLLNERPDLGCSMYDRHSDGSGVCYSSRLRPIVNFRPGVTNSWVGAAGTIPWQFNADLPLVDWLEHERFDFDVATDEDLHRFGMDLLDSYPVVLTGSHPEYYSTAMHDALDRYLRHGGRLMYLGGNGFYWRIAYHSTLPGVIELRRAEDGIRDWVAQPGEYYMSFSGEYGGMWQRNGRPIPTLVGVGMAGQGFDISGWYCRTDASQDPRVAFMWDGMDDEVIGDFGTVGGGAAGIEVDRYAAELGSPLHALVVATSEGLSDTYYPGPEEIDGADSAMDAVQNHNVRADMTFFETPRGGAIFSTGSIAYLGSLSWNAFDNNVARLTGNVLRRFLDATPFVVPD